MNSPDQQPNSRNKKTPVLLSKTDVLDLEVRYWNSIFEVIVVSSFDRIRSRWLRSSHIFPESAMQDF